MMIDPSSPTIVLLHGAGATHGVWDSVLTGLSEFPTRVPDLPGHIDGNGQSHASVAGYASAIEHDLPDAPLVLVGHSMGGLIACELGARRDNIVGIVTIGTGALMAVNEDLLATAAKTPHFAMAPIRKWSLHRDASEDQKTQLENSTSHEAVEAIFDDLTACNTYVDATTRLAEFARPSVIAIGDEDRMVPRAEAEELAAASPSARLVIIENAGHTPQITRPDAIVSLIADFISAE